MKGFAAGRRNAGPPLCCNHLRHGDEEYEDREHSLAPSEKVNDTAGSIERDGASAVRVVASAAISRHCHL
jgi:hypothetical protein